MKNSGAWASPYDECDDGYENNIATIEAMMAGASLGALAGTKDFMAMMNMYSFPNTDDCYSFAFQLGFLQGLMFSDCDPNMYGELYDEMVRRIKEADDKAKKRQLNPFAPPGTAGGMGGGSGGGSSGGGGGGPC